MIPRTKETEREKERERERERNAEQETADTGIDIYLQNGRERSVQAGFVQCQDTTHVEEATRPDVIRCLDFCILVSPRANWTSVTDTPSADRRKKIRYTPLSGINLPFLVVVEETLCRKKKSR